MQAAAADAPGKAREAFLKELTLVANGIEKLAKGRVIAILDFRPEVLKEDEDPGLTLKASKLVQDQIYEALLSRGVLIYQVEKDHPLKVTFYVENLQDKKYYQGGFAQTGALGAALVVQGAPRSFGLEAEFSFF